MAAVALVGVLVAGCSCAPDKLTIAEASQPAFGLLYIADAKGYLREAGLEVRFQRFTLGRDALTSVLDGKADLATAWGTPTVIRLYEGHQIGILSTLHTSTRNTVLLGRRDRGLVDAAGIAGKHIGFARGSSAEYFLSILLATEGIDPSRVMHVEVDPEAFEEALMGGTVDGLVVFAPYHARLRALLGDQVASIRSKAYVETSMLVGMRAAMASRPQVMARLAGALSRAQDFASSHREESIAIVAARLHGLLDADAVRRGWDDVNLQATLGNTLIQGMSLEAQWLRDSGRFSGDLPDFRTAIVDGPLRSVRPDAVTLIASR